MDYLRIGSVFQTAANTSTLLVEQKTLGFMFVSAVCPKGLMVASKERPNVKLPVNRGAKIVLETKLGYEFTWPVTYHGNYATSPHAAASLWNSSGGTNLLDGSLYILVYHDCAELEYHTQASLLPVELSVEHTNQYHDGAVATETWGFTNLDYGTVYVTCRNVADDYTIPYQLQDRALTTDAHNLRALGFLTASHLVDSNTYSESGYLRLAGVANLRISIIADGVYLLDQSTEDTHFYYRFDDVKQDNPVVGLSVIKLYNTFTTSKNIDIFVPERCYGFAQINNISGVLCTSTAIYRNTATQYNNSLQVNSDPSSMMAGASLGGGISRSGAGVTSTGCDVMRLSAATGTTSTLIWTLRFHHQYI